MNRRLWWIVAAVVVVIGAPVAWYLGSPLFINRTVVEEFPLSGPGVIPGGMSRREAEDIMSNAAQEEHVMEEGMPAATPGVRARGAFVGADSFHMGSGDALVLDAGGRVVVRLENFRVTNGPDLYVYLSSHPNPRTSAQVHEGEVTLGRLKGNIGAQNYDVPAGTDLAAVRSVVIYCQRFHVLFASAPLQPAR